jgi:hypothetical protein
MNNRTNSDQTISVQTISWLGLENEAESVYCLLEKVSLNIV